ncbi:LuxR family two component transcriptional regulator [Glutamicibacter mysorens]|uniref:LuxR family two component transcriptional regulator n=1 Tax=Glutamicibacter mysorens TaxID=257984 RepID=A0ABX4N1N2_9MICC|nr:response regulator [Glutamicibacter mysorens]PJJ45188.1 LuxR family two component transcriptional regulator [Glutamicibacter mysorens]
MLEQPPVVYIVDDDQELCQSVQWLLESVDIQSESYTEVSSFLENYDPDRVACLVLDVRMPKVGGFQLQDLLVQRRSPMPIIFVSAHGDIRMSVKALRNGAVNFLEKPYDPQILLDSIQENLLGAEALYQKNAARQRVVNRVKTLTPRELTILGLVIEGLPSQNIARRLGMSAKTVDVHRARIKTKTDAESIPTLVRDILQYDVDINEV